MKKLKFGKENGQNEEISSKEEVSHPTVKHNFIPNDKGLGVSRSES